MALGMVLVLFGLYFFVTRVVRWNAYLEMGGGLLFPRLIGYPGTFVLYIILSGALFIYGIDLVINPINVDERPFSDNTHASRGYNAYMARQYDLAVEEFEQALNEELNQERRADIYWYLGNAYDLLGQYKEAVQALELAVDIQPGYHWLWADLGLAYLHTGDYDQAEACYQHALVIEPDYANAYVLLGEMHVYQAETQAAIRYFEYALSLDPGYAIAYAEVARSYAQAGRLKDADTALARAVELGYEYADIIQQWIDLYKTNELMESATKNQ